MKRRYSLFCAKERGFTIIELSVVIVVIGVLASIVIVSGGSYLKRSSESNAKTSLVTARAALKQEYDKNGEYPEDVPASASTPDGFTYNTNGSDFCIGGIIGGENWYISKDKSEPQQGACPDLVEPSNGFAAAFSDTNDIEIVGGEGEGIRLYSVTVTGGTPPYSYSLAADTGSSSGMIVDSYNNLNPESPEWMYVAFHPDYGGLLVYPPNPPVGEIPPGFEDRLILGSADDDDFVTMCNGWSPNNLHASLKVIVTDNDSNQAEVPFTLRCAS